MDVRVEIHRHSAETPWHYSDLDQRQRQIAREVASEVLQGRGAILLSEVAPVITLGRRIHDSEKHLLLSSLDYQKFGIEIYRADRGGLATYHGPGQWVLFVVDTLEALTGDRRGVRKAVDGLLEIARQVGESYVSSSQIREGCELGVWAANGKFASVGVHVEERVLLHGIAINGFKTPLSFNGLRPCGLEAPVSFLLNEEDDMAFEGLGKKIIEAAKNQFWRK